MQSLFSNTSDLFLRIFEVFKEMEMKKKKSLMIKLHKILFKNKSKRTKINITNN